jgi:uncharacterized membrane protein YbhN (UPF0104 family)
MSDPRRSRALVALRVVVSVLLLAFVLSRVDLRMLLKTFASISPAVLLGAAILNLLAVVLISITLRLVLASHGAAVRLGTLVRFTLVGHFFNNIMPTSVGGDVMKAVLLGREVRDGGIAALSVLETRVSNVTANVVFAGIGLILASQVTEMPTPVVVAVLVLLSGLVAAAVALPWLSRRMMFAPAAGAGLVARGRSLLARGAELYRKREGSSRRRAAVFLSSAAYQTVGIAYAWMLGRAIGIDLPLSVFAALIPVISVAALIPVSFNGRGVIEGSFVFLFSRFGVSAELALGLSLVITLFNLLVSALGGLTLLVGASSSRPAAGDQPA